MKIALTLICLFLISCNSSNQFNRGYVISKSQVEQESEPVENETP